MQRGCSFTDTYTIALAYRDREVNKANETGKFKYLIAYRTSQEACINGLIGFSVNNNIPPHQDIL
jgi:hypothetical protein